MAGERKEFRLSCPCCTAELVIDPETGAVISHEVPRNRKSFEEAFASEMSRKAKSDERFGQAMDQQQKRVDILSKKFEQAKKKAAKDDKPVRNPLDWD
jgi:hypothetical protein